MKDFAEQAHFRSVDDRRGERFDVEGEVYLRVLFTKSKGTDLREIKARCVNVGVGGLFVETAEPIEPGALADLNLQLEGKPLANTLGLVRWLKPGEGAGIEFFYATYEERDALKAYLLDWVKERRRKAEARKRLPSGEGNGLGGGSGGGADGPLLG